MNKVNEQNEFNDDATHDDLLAAIKATLDDPKIGMFAKLEMLANQGLTQAVELTTGRVVVAREHWEQLSASEKYLYRTLQHSRFTGDSNAVNKIEIVAE